MEAVILAGEEAAVEVADTQAAVEVVADPPSQRARPGAVEAAGAAASVAVVQGVEVATPEGVVEEEVEEVRIKVILNL